MHVVLEMKIIDADLRCDLYLVRSGGRDCWVLCKKGASAKDVLYHLADNAARLGIDGWLEAVKCATHRT